MSPGIYPRRSPRRPQDPPGVPRNSQETPRPASQEPPGVPRSPEYFPGVRSALCDASGPPRTSQELLASRAPQFARSPQFVPPKSSQETAGLPRSAQDLPGAPRTLLPGLPRRFQEPSGPARIPRGSPRRSRTAEDTTGALWRPLDPGVPRSSHDPPGPPRSVQDSSGATESLQESPGFPYDLPRNSQEFPGVRRSPQNVPGPLTSSQVSPRVYPRRSPRKPQDPPGVPRCSRETPEPAS